MLTTSLRNAYQTTVQFHAFLAHYGESITLACCPREMQNWEGIHLFIFTCVWLLVWMAA